VSSCVASVRPAEENTATSTLTANSTVAQPASTISSVAVSRNNCSASRNNTAETSAAVLDGGWEMLDDPSERVHALDALGESASQRPETAETQQVPRPRLALPQPQPRASPQPRAPPQLRASPQLRAPPRAAALARCITPVQEHRGFLGSNCCLWLRRRGILGDIKNCY